MPKMLRRQKTGNKLECLYPSVCWGGRNEFMLHSLPRPFVTESSIMEKRVHFVFLWKIKWLYSWTYLYKHSSDSHDVGKNEVGQLTLVGTGELISDKGAQPRLPTCEHVIQWLNVFSSWKFQTVHFIPRQLDSCGLWFPWVDAGQSPSSGQEQWLRWRNPWPYPNMNIWF